MKNEFSDAPPERVTDGVRLACVGHVSWLIQTAGLNILVDPVWSERASPFTFAGPKRALAPGIDFDKLPKIDAVLVSHGHYDHLDTATLSRLSAKFGPRVDHAARQRHHACTPPIRTSAPRLSTGTIASRSATASPRRWCRRDTGRRAACFDRNKALWASFVLETPAGNVYIVCDSGYGTGSHFRNVRDRYGCCARRSSPSAPMSRAGSCATST